MSGTVSGGKKTAQKNIELHGKDFYKEIGRKGGKRSTTGGFASQKVGKDGLTGLERARLAGSKGGLISRGKLRSVREIAKSINKNSEFYKLVQDYIPTPNEGQKNDK